MEAEAETPKAKDEVPPTATEEAADETLVEEADPPHKDVDSKPLHLGVCPPSFLGRHR